MPLFAAAILAQVLTLGTTERTELRLVVDRNAKNAQSESRALGFLTLDFRHAELGLGYSPSVIISPLQSADREITLLQSVFATARVFGGTRRTEYELSESLEVAQRNFLVEALSARAPTPTQPGGATTNGQPTDAPGAAAGQDGMPPPSGQMPTGTQGTATTTATPTYAAPQTVLTGSERTRATLLRQLSRTDSFLSAIGYTVSGGLNRESRATYPVVHGPDATLALNQRLSRHDNLGSSIGASATFSARGDRAWTVGENENLSHTFSPSTQGSLGAGVAFTQRDPATEPRSNNVYGLASASLVHSAPFARGTLSERLTASYAPVLDRVAVSYDPRLSLSAAVAWAKGRFTIALTTDTSLSLHPTAKGGLDSSGASLIATYQLGAGFAVDGGARAAWQTYQGQETIPPSGALFVGLSWGATASP